ncbi:MAG: hypothetical protein IJY92_00550 [Alphaproteobacteria bacterium]|nr:hypothetical protein [Alphaproteobacteria bacterium]
MPKRIHKVEYYQLKLPFLFDMVCKDKRVYNVKMTFLYAYPARAEGALRPSVFAQKPEVLRLHYFLTRTLTDFLKEYRHVDFPIEWQEYFPQKQKKILNRPYPYASDEQIKKYLSDTQSDMLRGYIIREGGMMKERLDYLLADLKINTWRFLIESCTPQKRVSHVPENKVLRLYTDLRTHLRD